MDFADKDNVPIALAPSATGCRNLSFDRGARMDTSTFSSKFSLSTLNETPPV